MNKHAYLIIAHNNIPMLIELLSALDDERNDIYLHYDKKSPLTEQDIASLQNAVKYSHFTLIDRISVVWGGYSQVQCELKLIKAASGEHYSYYHLLSGIDFPIKSKDYIYNFFEERNGEEFIDFWDKREKEFLYRVKYYYPLQEQIGTYTYDIHTLLLRVRSKLGILNQKLHGVNRLKKFTGTFKTGSNWFSITDSFAHYLLANEKQIYRLFHDGIAVDEMFIHTLCYNSRYMERVSKTPVRLIDWKRGNPYVWQENDLNEILQSECLFTRKITSPELAQTIYSKTSCITSGGNYGK
jgi:hypothetical protein